MRANPILSIILMIFLTACGLSPTPASTSAGQTEALAPIESADLITPTQELINTETKVPTDSVEQITPTLELIETDPSRSGIIHFLTGHGEFYLSEEREPLYYGERSFTQLKSALELLGYTIATIDLGDGDVIPEDAQVIIIAGPTAPLTRVEVSQLQTFVDGGGSLVVMVEPPLTYEFRTQADPLAEYLEAFWDIRLGNDAVLEQSSGEPSLTIQAEVAGQHAITENVGKVSVVFDSVRSVTPIEGTELSLVELAKSSEQTWAETEMDLLLVGIAAGALGNSKPDEGVDLPGPLTLAVVGEHTSGSRVAIFGDADFASDAFFSEPGNEDILINTIDWALHILP